MDTNTVVFSGRLVADTEDRYTATDKPITSGTIAINKYFAKDSPVKKEDREKSTIFMDFQAWGKYKGFKGDTVCIIGKLATWIDKDGGRHYKVEVNSDGIFIKSKQAKQENNDDDWSIP